MELDPGTDFAGRFRVVRKIGSGGCGTVYEASALADGDRVALKVLHPEFVSHPTLRERFEQEAPIARSIPSDRVVQVYDAGVDGPSGCPWVALELLEGESLAALLEREPVPPKALVVSILEGLGDALGAAHQVGVIHADLKPENLFLVGPASAPRLKVLDFGIARMLKAGRTSTKVTTEMGTPAWSAPEQFRRGAKLRPSTDAWSLGLLAFQLLTGHHYLRNADTFLTALLHEILHEPLPLASARAESLGVEGLLPPGFDPWFRLCVARDQDERFQHGRAAMTALLGLLRSAPDPEVPLPLPPLRFRPESAETLPRAGNRLSGVGALLDGHDYAAAQQLLDEAASSSPAIWALRGECALGLGRYDEAVLCWSEAIARAPSEAGYLHGRARVFEAQGLEAAARADRALASVLEHAGPRQGPTVAQVCPRSEVG